MPILRYKHQSWTIKPEDCTLSSTLSVLGLDTLVHISLPLTPTSTHQQIDSTLLHAIEMVLTYLKQYKKKRPKPLLLPLISNIPSGFCTSAWDTQFVTLCLKDIQMCCDIIVLAHQWGIAPLQELGCAALSCQIRGKTLHQLMISQRLGPLHGGLGVPGTAGMTGTATAIKG